jgi:hypothetical protein
MRARRISVVQREPLNHTAELHAEGMRKKGKTAAQVRNYLPYVCSQVLCFQKSGSGNHCAAKARRSEKRINLHAGQNAGGFENAKSLVPCRLTVHGLDGTRRSC